MQCICSIRALSVLSQDAVGMNLRRQRAQRFFQQCRGFAARPSSFKTKAPLTRATDDDFVPFESASDIVDGIPSAVHTKLADRPLQEQDSDEEWHAEVEINSTIEPAISTQTSLRHDRNQLRRSNRPVLELPAISQHIPLPAQTAGSTTRSENRKQRKERRMRDGMYRAAAHDKTKVAESISQKEAGKTDQIVAGETGGNRRASKEADNDIAHSGPAQGGSAHGDNVNGQSKSNVTTKQPPPPQSKPKKEPWQIQKAALERKFGEKGWQPRKRLSPDTLEGLRALHASDPATYSTGTLAEHFSITPEAVRRILKSKWKPKPEEIEARMQRWEKRGVRKWEEMAKRGVKPPKKWRELGVDNPVLRKKLGGEDGSDEVMSREGRGNKQRRTRWNDVVATAERLPREGYLADRIL